MSTTKQPFPVVRIRLRNHFLPAETKKTTLDEVPENVTNEKVPTEEETRIMKNLETVYCSFNNFMISLQVDKYIIRAESQYRSRQDFVAKLSLENAHELW